MFPESKKELERSIRRARRRPINRYLLIRAMKAIEGMTYDDIGGKPEEKLATIYRLAHASLNHCNGIHEDWKREIIFWHKAMVYFGVSEP